VVHCAAGGALLVLTLAACGGDPSLDDEEVSVAQETGALVTGSAQLQTILEPFQAPAALADTSVNLAGRLTIEAIELALGRDTSRPGCLTVDTDLLTFIEATFDNCGAGALDLARLDGSIRADIGFQTTACAAGLCPEVLELELAFSDLRVSGPGGAQFVEIDGTASTSDPIGEGDTTLSGDLDFESPRGLASFDLDTRFRTDAADCVTATTTAHALVEGSGGLSADIAYDARGVVRCPGECPSAGEVEMSFGAGSLLAWSYTGEATVSVIGPRGKEADVALACGLE
jgi:hypothetical protein